MATSSIENVISIQAGGDLSATDFRFVKMHSVANELVSATADTDLLIGIRVNSPEDTEMTSVQIGGKAKITLGGTVTIGACLTADTAGSAVATSTDAKVYGAIALQAGDSGEVIECIVTPYQTFAG